MAVSLKEVERIAMLARLEFSDQEKQALTRQLNEILMYIEKLKKVDTESVEPFLHVLDMSNRMREDDVKGGLSQEEALKNAPDRTDSFFKVPNVRGKK